MAERARSYLGKDILLLLGGFHLRQAGRTEIRTVIERLKNLKVKKVAPSHCTGDTAIQMFRELWGTDFVEGGLGAYIDLPW
jgi:7,8-dihydropterin-6-yl-methyl-4-(beta-D-ribofuranosyl)aminobenzene 5'-phosphate synthase